MQHGGSGNLSIIAACVYDDKRMGPSAQRMLGVLGTYADSKTGMCRPDQRTLAARLGITRQAVSRALRDLAKAGYIEIIERYSDFNGARLASHYRLIMDVHVPAEHRRTPQPDVAPPLSPDELPPQPERDTLLSVVDTPPQPELASNKEERLIGNDPGRTTHMNVVPAPPPAATATAAPAIDQAKILRSLTAEAREILDWHRECHGRRQPAKLTPESARVLEAAVADLGVERLRESVKYMAGKIPPVPELSKALSAARTKRQWDENPSSVPQARNGTSAGATVPAKGSIAARVKSERY